MAVGRPKGRKTSEAAKKNRSIREKAREEAPLTGDLPHEWMLKVARGERVIQRKVVIEYHKTGPEKGQVKSRKWVKEFYYPTFDQRMDAAKASAPFYAPKLAAQVTKTVETNEGLIEAFDTLAKKIEEADKG